MAVKTITITKDAYEALKAKKEARESFSQTILRITKRPRLRDFYGILSPGAGRELERNIMELREERRARHERRMKRIVKALEESSGMS